MPRLNTEGSYMRRTDSVINILILYTMSTGMSPSPPVLEDDSRTACAFQDSSRRMRCSFIVFLVLTFNYPAPDLSRLQPSYP